MRYLADFQPIDEPLLALKQPGRDCARRQFDATDVLDQPHGTWEVPEWLDETYPLDVRAAADAPPWVRLWPGRFRASIRAIDSQLYARCEGALRPSPEGTEMAWRWIGLREYDDRVEFVFTNDNNDRAYVHFKDGDVSVSDIPW